MPSNADTGGFVAGTVVETTMGKKAIENVGENSRVLTRAGESQQWGVRSDEVVMVPASDNLYSFNGSDPFFTAGQPFYTTTGIRAIDPVSARQQNPWLDVGTLKIGHALLRLNATNTSYDLEEIKSIMRSRSQGGNVYGLHFREGLRSYHANGYLVSLNYPEITGASLSYQLRTMPDQDRTKALQSLRDLKLLFDRFGAGSIMDCLVTVESFPNS
ncbi:hypothetical protein BKA59DRAFT_476111 [Fusarium tricinctum]|uniref:Uncharacterized protein n=1 Tax=Fusarium tricinctum TaxID=61284 RepID=A0A8K0WC45_9HYPO|nr:hypothetical protein BKA59DRAFT_476111 [Fusarium tricinctum]